MTDTIIVTPPAPIQVTVVPTSSSSSTPTNVAVYTSTPGPTGPAGPKGDNGTSGGSFNYTQNTASTTWAITHNLGYNPAVTTTDVTNFVIEGTVQYINTNSLTITFGIATTGYAYLS